MRVLTLCGALLLAPMITGGALVEAAQAQAAERYILLSNAPASGGGLRQVVAEFVGVNGQWTELQNGVRRFTFREVFRENGTIYIHDDSRGAWVRLIPVGTEHCRGDYGMSPYPTLPTTWIPLQNSH